MQKVQKGQARRGLLTSPGMRFSSSRTNGTLRKTHYKCIGVIRIFGPYARYPSSFPEYVGSSAATRFLPKCYIPRARVEIEVSRSKNKTKKLTTKFEHAHS